MALNDIKVPKENASGTFDEITLPDATTSARGLLTGADKTKLNNLGTAATKDAPATGNASSTQVVLGNDTRLSVTPASIGAASALEVRTGFDPIQADTVLSSGRNVSIRITSYESGNLNVTLPITGNQAGDKFVLYGRAYSSGDIIIQKQNHDGTGGGPRYASLVTIDTANLTQYTFVAENTSSGSWGLSSVDTHTHAASDITSGSFGNISHDGKVGSTSGLPVVTTTAGAVTTLALGTAYQVLRVNSGATAVEFADPAASGVTSVTGTAPISSSGGTTPAISISAATTSAAGSMSSADKTKLDGIATAATANSSDATLLARANHTGTQAASTITGLAAIATSGSATDLSGTIPIARLGASGTPSGSTYLAGDNSWKAAGGVVSGNIDNSVLRADGAGGSTSQGSDLVIDDAVVSFNITGDASTDVITAVGHNFTDTQGVRFPTLTGGAGLTAATTNYFVRDISGNTFKVSTTSGGAAVNFTTNITAGTVIAMQANVAIRNNSSETNSALVLTPKGNGALILGAKPDGTATVGGNPRGENAVEFQASRNAATQVASGTRSIIIGGANNTATGQEATLLSAASSTASGSPSCVLISSSATASGDRSAVIASGSGTANNSYAIVAQGFQTTSSAAQAMALGNYALADRAGMMARAYFTFSSAGETQRAWYSPLFNKTSVATATELFTDGSAIRLTIPSGKTISMFINIVAATSGGEFANRYVRAVTIANRGGTTALRGAVKDIDTEEQITGADVTVSANDTNDALRVEFSGVAPVTGCTAAASTDVISKTAHGFSNNDDIVFTLLTGGAGLTANTVTYWVINATADTFQVSATRGGAAVNITTDYSAMTAARLFRVVAYVDGAEVAFGV